MALQNYIIFVLGLQLLATHIVLGTNPRGCTSVYRGYKSKYPLKMTPTILPAFVQKWQLNIPKKCDHPVGTLVEICDGVAPTVDVLTDSLAVVTRWGSLRFPAKATVTQFCIYAGPLPRLMLEPEESDVSNVEEISSEEIENKSGDNIISSEDESTDETIIEAEGSYENNIRETKDVSDVDISGEVSEEIAVNKVGEITIEEIPADHE